MSLLTQHAAKAVARGDYEVTDTGIIIDKGIKAVGRYIERVNGGEFREHANLVPDEGLVFILNVALGVSTKAAGFYLAPFSGGTNPAAGWTAANFAGTASEITSLTEGFSNATRPVWTTTPAAADGIDNADALAVFAVVATTSIVVTGAGLLSSNVRGGTSGFLVSASKFSTARTLYNGDVWELGYRVALLDS